MAPSAHTIITAALWIQTILPSNGTEPEQSPARFWKLSSQTIKLKAYDETQIH